MKENGSKRNVVILAVITLAILGFIATISLSSQKIMILYIIIVGFGTLIYGLPDTRKYALGLRAKGSGKAILIGLLCLFGFYFGTLIIPGFSLGFPSLPQAISTELRWFVVNIIAPVAESIGIIAAFFALFMTGVFFRKHLYLTISLVSLIFALYHLGAYIIGFENLPSLANAFPIIFQNISPFMAAFIFSWISLIVAVTWTPNLLFLITFHFVNILISYKQSVGNVIIT